MQIHIAITGASGTIYAARLAMKLINNEAVTKIYITLTATAKKVAPYELGDNWLDEITASPKVQMLNNEDYFTEVASGSSAPEAMVMAPCSMGMLARVANGISNDLISRAADVMIKEKRILIIVPRETPLSIIHLQNMLTLAKTNAVILPAVPSFYAKPQSIEQLIDSVVERIVDHLKLNQTKYSWNKNNE